MKLLYTIAFILLGQFVFSQQPFQGTIVYGLHASKEKEDAELMIQFGLNKIKVKLKEKLDYDKSYLVIDLDSGKVFTINTESKTYQVKTIKASSPAELNPSPKTIAGYSTQPVNLTPNFSPLLAGMFYGKTTFYVANDLYFPVAEKYASAPELVMLNNQHVILGMTIVTSYPYSDAPEDSAKQVIITAEAKSVERKQFDKNEFTVPTDYTLRTEQDWISDTTNIMADSTMMYVDTTAMYPVEEKPVKSKPQTPPTTPKKKTPVKGEATKPKKTVPRS